MRTKWAGLFLCVAGLAFAATTGTDVPSDGSVLPAGSAVEAPAGTWTVQGAGADIWGAADQFYFLYNPVAVSGDFSVSCHLVSLTGGDVNWAKAGIMARVPEGTVPEFTTSGQQFQFVCTTSAQGICHQYRDATNGNASDTQDAGEGTRQNGIGLDNVWLKLERSGDTFSAYMGILPGVWVGGPGAHTNLTLAGADMYVGLAITSHLGGTLATAVIDNVNWNDVPTSMNGPTDFVCATNGANVDLSWTNTVAYSAITIYRRSAVTGAITPITVVATADTYTDTPGEGVWTYYIVAKEGGSDCLSPAGCSASVSTTSAGFIDTNGFFRSWVMLGPLAKNGGCSPALAEQLGDYLTDGVAITQANVLPKPLDTVTPANALCIGIRGWDPVGLVEALNLPSLNGQNSNAAAGEAEWALYHSATDTVDHQAFYGQDPNENMVYHVTYLTNSGAARLVYGGIASDDAIVVMLDNSVIYENPLCRGYGAAGEVQNRFPFFLPVGEHRLVVKVFEGGGGSGMRMRLEETNGTVITSGISIKTAPTMASVPAEQASAGSLTCVASGANVQLTWTNPTSWDDLAAVRQNADGSLTVLAGVTPTSTSLLTPFPMGNVNYVVVGRKGNVASTITLPCAFKGSALVDAQGYIRSWLLLGPLAQAGGADPGAVNRYLDYLATKDVPATTELNVLPSAGDEMEIDFGATARSTAILGWDGAAIVNNLPTANGQNPDAASGIATWYEYESNTNTEEFDTIWLGNGNSFDNFVAYGVCYIENVTLLPVAVTAKVASDDTCVWELDTAVVGTTYCCADTTFGLVIPPGEHRLMGKTFEGGGGNWFRLGLVDPATGLWDDRIIARTAPDKMVSVPPPATATATRRLPGAMITGFETTVSIEVAVQAIDIFEQVPNTMTIGTVSNGGTKNGQQITWTNIPAGTTVTYRVTPTGAGGKFQGAAKETVSGAWLVIGGATTPVVPQTLVDGWLTADIADSGIAGTATATKTGTTYSMSVKGSGHDIWDAADDFRFVWKSFPADKSLVMQCQVQTILGGTNTWAKYGLMFRTLPTQGSPSVYAVYSRDGQGDTVPDAAFQWRDASDAAANWPGFPAENLNHELPAWIRMVYQNGVVTAYWSDDDGGDAPLGWYGGVSHTLNLEGQTSFLAGVCVTSHDDAQLTTGSFKFVEVVSLCEPVTVTRSFGTTNLTNLDGVPAAIYGDGDDLTVSLALTNPRVAGECPALGEVIITETVPAGFTVSGISNGGTEAGGIITWRFTAGTTLPASLAYTINGTLGGNAVAFAGDVTENPLPNEFGPFPVLGMKALVSANGLGVDAGIEGVVLSWLFLGPFGANTYDGTANHILDEMQKDFLTDGTKTELNVQPRAGDEIKPDYGNLSAAIDLRAAANPAVNPKRDQQIATWFPFRYSGQYYEFTNPGLYGVNDYEMNYSVAYLDVKEETSVIFAMGSDDAIQVLLDGAEIWNYTLGRGFPGFVDLSPAQTLTVGVHTLMVKCFNGNGGWNQSVQILDAGTSTPFTNIDAICVSLNPDGCGGVTPPPMVYVKMGAVNAGPGVDIADAIALLGYLFAQKAAPLCAKAADANDDDALNIADAITILGYLFSGKPMFAPDHAEIKAANNTCKGYAANGTDPTPPNKPFFPAKIGALNACDTQCTP